jgi:Ca2+-binding EF-hand superfamily protein
MATAGANAALCLLALGPPAAAQSVIYPSEAAREQDYFERCDHDSSGWIAYREAAHSLLITRAEFPIYDLDRDGRISREEFGERYRKVVDQTGAFPEPLLGGPTKAISRDPEQLLRAFDQNADRSIGDFELSKLLGDYARSTLSVDVLLAELDRDGDKKLQGAELSGLARVLTAPLEPAQPPPDSRPTSLDELFGEVIPREQRPGSPQQPPRIPGPVTHFRRLDLDDDGVISLDDLQRLQSPLQVSARVNAALASLDVNGDEVVDYTEFRASM